MPCHPRAKDAVIHHPIAACHLASTCCRPSPDRPHPRPSPTCFSGSSSLFPSRLVLPSTRCRPSTRRWSSSSPHAHAQDQHGRRIVDAEAETRSSAARHGQMRTPWPSLCHEWRHAALPRGVAENRCNRACLTWGPAAPSGQGLPAQFMADVASPR
ncbi:hypothetical protein BKA80DRAFT_273722 [Phyllosticta citrichinensis]